MQNVIASFAQFENDVKSERTKSGMIQVLREGRWVWNAPIGYKHVKGTDNKSVLTPTQDGPFIAETFELLSKEVYAQTEIIKRMRRKGFKKLTKQTLCYILRNPLYAGLIKTEWLSDMVKGIHKPLIPEELFWRVQAILDGRKPAALPKLRNHPDFPLRNFLMCPLCQQKLTGSWSKGRAKRYAYYHCRTRGCSYRGIPKKEAEAFYAFLEDLRPSEAVLDLFTAIVLDVWNQKHAERLREQNHLEIDLRALENRKRRIEELVIQGTFNEQTYKEQVAILEQELIAKRVELNEAKIERNDAEGCLNYCRYWLTNLAKLWANGGVDLRQRFQTLVCPQGASYQDGKVQPLLSLQSSRSYRWKRLINQK